MNAQRMDGKRQEITSVSRMIVKVSRECLKNEASMAILLGVVLQAGRKRKEGFDLFHFIGFQPGIALPVQL